MPLNYELPERLDRWLLHNRYLRNPTVEETLLRYKVPELKGFLSKKAMKVTGKKAELIERLVSVLSESEIKVLLDSDKRYYLSEKGLKHYYDNIDLNELHRNWKYGIPLNEYFKYRKSNGVIRGFYETAYLALQEKIKNGVISIYNKHYACRKCAKLNYSSQQKSGMDEKRLKMEREDCGAVRLSMVEK